MNKPDQGKKPIQNTAKEEQTEILTEKSTPTEKPKRGRPKGTTKKKTPELQMFDEVRAQQEARSLFMIVEKVREGAGVTEPINDHVKVGFIQGVVAMERKYGDAMSKYMPEIMFFGSLFYIGFDTVKELKKIQLEKIKAEKKPDKTLKNEDEKQPPGNTNTDLGSIPSTERPDK